MDFESRQFLSFDLICRRPGPASPAPARARPVGYSGPLILRGARLDASESRPRTTIPILLARRPRAPPLGPSVPSLLRLLALSPRDRWVVLSRELPGQLQFPKCLAAGPAPPFRKGSRSRNFIDKGWCRRRLEAGSVPQAKRCLFPEGKTSRFFLSHEIGRTFEDFPKNSHKFLDN